MNASDVRGLVATSRAAQGLPPLVTDASALAKVATVVADPRNGNGAPLGGAGTTIPTTVATRQRGRRE